MRRPPHARSAVVVAALACALAAPASAQEDLTEARRAEPLGTEAAERLCEQAAALVDADYPKDGEQLYKQLLGRADCATAELVAAARAAQEPTEAEKLADRDDQLAVIDGLHREGFDDEAREKAEALVAADPDADIPDDVGEPTQPLAFFRDAVAVAGPWIVTVLALLAIPAALAAAIWLVTRRRRHRVRLGEFDGSDEKSLTQSLASALEDHLGRLREQGHGAQLHHHSATDAKFEVPQLEVPGLPQLGTIASLLNGLARVVPENVDLVRGTVRPVDPSLGAGITVVLTDRKNGTIAQQTVWERDFLLLDEKAKAEDQSRYARLLMPAAVWLAYREKLGFDAAKPPLGTRDWRSYALFAAGEMLERDGDEATARRAYERALDADPANLGAKLNLGSLMLHPTGAERGEEAGRRLAAARRLLGAVCANATDWTNPLPYRTRYLCAIADLYAGEPERALDHLRRLRAAIVAHEGDEALAPLLRSLSGPSRVIEQSAHVMLGEQPDLSPFDGDWTSAAVRYNLACLYVRWAQRGPDAERPRRLEAALSHLEAARDRLSARARRHARLDPALQPLRDDPQLRKRFDAIFPPDPSPPRPSWTQALLALFGANGTQRTPEPAEA